MLRQHRLKQSKSIDLQSSLGIYYAWLQGHLRCYSQPESHSFPSFSELASQVDCQEANMKQRRSINTVTPRQWPDAAIPRWFHVLCPPFTWKGGSR